MGAIRLTAQDQARLVDAQRLLLSPLTEPGIEQWQLRCNRAVRDFIGADHSVFSLPIDPSRPPPQVTNDVDPALPDRLRTYLRAGAGSYYSSPDPYLERVHKKRVDGGTGAYHLDFLLSPQKQRASDVMNDVFFPAGLTVMVGLSMPLHDRPEATQFFGYERREDAERHAPVVEKLALLVPAFVAGIRESLRWHDRPGPVAAQLDVVDQPMALYGQDGRLLHRNRALEAVLLDDPESERLGRAMDDLANDFQQRSHGPKRAQHPVSTAVERRLDTREGSYRLWGVYTRSPLDARGRIIVQLERAGPQLPDPATLTERHGLTEREAEVALLMAQGQSDKGLARRLDISWHTARTHARNVLSKLDLSSRAQVALALLRREI